MVVESAPWGSVDIDADGAPGGVQVVTHAVQGLQKLLRLPVNGRTRSWDGSGWILWWMAGGWHVDGMWIG